jgi:Ribbon-helix-helix protein, copG family
MTESTRVFSISLPLDLAEQVERTAAAEGRSISEIFEDGFRAYRAVSVRKLLSKSQAAYQQAGLAGTEEEIEQMIREELQAVRQSKHG